MANQCEQHDRLLVCAWSYLSHGVLLVACLFTLVTFLLTNIPAGPFDDH